MQPTFENVTLDGLLPWIIGPAGGFVLALIALYLLFKGHVVPKVYYDACLKRVALLEGENSELHETIKNLWDEKSDLRVELASLRGEVAASRGEIEHLRLEIAAMRGSQ